MKLKFIRLLLLLLATTNILLFSQEGGLIYKIQKIEKGISIDGNWDKNIWNNVDAIQLKNYMGSKPEHFPTVFVKLVYSDTDLYVIFKVLDQYVKSIAQEYQGKVYEDSCVEFFFTPADNSRNGYFNLETNCGGVQLFGFNSNDGVEDVLIKYEDYKNIEVAHSLPKLIDNEIKEKVTWYIEYKIPIEVLSKYFENVKLVSETVWRGNFYKCADKTSHPHWLTWNKVENPTPNFHLPQFFGTLIFE